MSCYLNPARQYLEKSGTNALLMIALLAWVTMINPTRCSGQDQAMLAIFCHHVVYWEEQHPTGQSDLM
jgi:hypothetical protein